MSWGINKKKLIHTISIPEPHWLLQNLKKNERSLRSEKSMIYLCVFHNSRRTKRSERFRWSGRSGSLWRIEDPGVLKGLQYTVSNKAKNKGLFQISSKIWIQNSVNYEFWIHWISLIRWLLRISNTTRQQDCWDILDSIYVTELEFQLINGHMWLVLLSSDGL